MRKIIYQQGLTAEDVTKQQRIGPSFLKAVKRSPAHAWAQYIDPDREESTSEAMRIGRILHTAILEPDTFNSVYAVKLTVENLANECRENLAVGAEDLRAMIDRYNSSKPTKLSLSGSISDLKQRIIEAGTELDPGTIEVMKGSDLKAEIETMNKSRIDPLSKSGTINEMRDRLVAAGVPVVLFADLLEQQYNDCTARNVEIIKPEDKELAYKIRDKIRSKRSSQILLDHPESEYEVELVYRCPLTGIILSCRIDYLIKPCADYPNGLICDPKFSESAQKDAFGAAVRRYVYQIQAAWNTAAVQAVFGTAGRPEFVWLAAEKEAPYASQYYWATPEQISIGDFWMERLLPVVAECLKTGYWPEYDAYLADFEPLEPSRSELYLLEEMKSR